MQKFTNNLPPILSWQTLKGLGIDISVCFLFGLDHRLTIEIGLHHK